MTSDAHSRTSLDAALRDAERCPWPALAPARRARAFELALREFALHPDPDGDFRAAMGVALGPLVPALGRRLGRAFAAGARRAESEATSGSRGGPLESRRTRGGSPEVPPGAPAIVAVDVISGPGPALGLVLEELGAGRHVVVLVPEVLAAPFEALIEALDAALPRSFVGPPPVTLRSTPSPALELATVARLLAGEGCFVAAVPAAEVRPLVETLWSLIGGDEAGARQDAAAPDPRVQAVREEMGPLTVHALGAATLVVGEHDDPVQCAARIVRHAFGPAVAGGHCVAAVGAVWVHPRRSASFHAALLEALEGSAAPAAEAIGLVQPFRGAHEALLRIGLDEGATLIHTSGRATGTSKSQGRSVSLRAVFTNVDPHSRLMRELSPAGVLRLLRVAPPRSLQLPSTED